MPGREITYYRRAIGECMQRLRLAATPQLRVDLGGRLYSDWLMETLDTDDFQTWDIVPGADTNRVVDARCMPEVPTASVGTIICTSLLEHVDAVWLAAQEITRVVRPGGQLFVAAPFMYRNHDAPQDFWRFTPEALRFLFHAREGWREIEGGWLGEQEGAYLYAERMK